MLRQFIAGALLLFIVVAVTYAAQDDVGRASLNIDGSRAQASSAIDNADALLSSGDDIRKEMGKVSSVTPAKLGNLDGLEPAHAPVDVDALLAKYSELGLVKHASGNRLLVFVSASVPMASLRLIARQAAMADATLVLRGVVNNGFPETAEFMRDVLGESEPRAKAIIDPTLFAKFGVRQVPAFVVVPGGACTGGGALCPPETPAHLHIAGDVTIQYALEYIARNHLEHRQIADALLSKIEGRE